MPRRGAAAARADGSRPSARADRRQGPTPTVGAGEAAFATRFCRGLAAATGAARRWGSAVCAQISKLEESSGEREAAKGARKGELIAALAGAHAKHEAACRVRAWRAGTQGARLHVRAAAHTTVDRASIEHRRRSRSAPRRSSGEVNTERPESSLILSTPSHALVDTAAAPSPSPHAAPGPLLAAALPMRATKRAEVCEARGSKRSVCVRLPGRLGPPRSAATGRREARGSSRRKAATTSSFC